MTKETFEKAINMRAKYRFLPNFISEDQKNVDAIVSMFEECKDWDPEKAKEILVTLIKGVNELIAERRKEFDAEIEAL